MSLPNRSGLLAGLVLVLTAAACATGQRNVFEAVRRVDEAVLLSVENNDFRDATIYAYWTGAKSRVGMVIGKTTKTFRMRWRNDEIRLEVDFVGGGGFLSETIDVRPGEDVNFVILPGR